MKCAALSLHRATITGSADTASGSGAGSRSSHACAGGLSLEDIRQILAIRQEADGGAGRTAFAVDKLEARRAQLVELQQLTELALAEVTGGALMPKRAQRFEIAAG